MPGILSYGELKKRPKRGEKAAGFMQGFLTGVRQLQEIKFLKKNQTPSATGLSGADAQSRSGGDDLFRIAKIDKADAVGSGERLQEKEKQFRDLYDNAPVAYYSVSAADGSIIDCNLAAQRLSGYSKKTGRGSDRANYLRIHEKDRNHGCILILNGQF